MPALLRAPRAVVLWSTATAVHRDRPGSRAPDAQCFRYLKYTPRGRSHAFAICPESPQMPVGNGVRILDIFRKSFGETVPAPSCESPIRSNSVIGVHPKDRGRSPLLQREPHRAPFCRSRSARQSHRRTQLCRSRLRPGDPTGAHAASLSRSARAHPRPAQRSASQLTTDH